MNETAVTMIGNVATEVSYSETTGGVPMASFRLASTERRYDRAAGGWVEGDTHWVSVTAWRALAVHVIGSLGKGDPVMVSGRLKVREWVDGEVRRCRVEIDARSVGHDLSRGTTTFRRASPGAGEPAGEPAGEVAGSAVGSVGGAVPGWIVDALAVRKAVAAAAKPEAGVSGGGVDGVPGGVSEGVGRGDEQGVLI
ncbi:single-stranded DNA-binding protein [Kitasatospora sp. NPDC058170]|uniref:single-stranded DNA-binding protein n=1 Tax=Kitasatospora sp. NPDC058170 TaxID=3346364 RepID=UPI0036DC2BF3